jgi:hypothetical protein
MQHAITIIMSSNINCTVPSRPILGTAQNKKKQLMVGTRSCSSYGLSLHVAFMHVLLLLVISIASEGQILILPVASSFTPSLSRPRPLSLLFATADDEQDANINISNQHNTTCSNNNNINNNNINNNNINNNNINNNNVKEDAQPLSLSQDDLKRFTQIKSRQKKIPTMMMKKIVLPGESVSFGSNDVKFNTMMDAVEMEGLALLGTSEGNTMAFGVTTKIQELSSANDGYTSVQLKADQVFQIIDSPFLDDTESFYYCNIDILPVDNDMGGGDGDSDCDSNQYGTRLQEATKMYNQIPDLVELLVQRIGVKQGDASLKKTADLVESFGEVPETSFSDRAFWVAALIHRMGGAEGGATAASTNDCVASGTTSDLKPRILSAKSDFERLRLSWSALHEAIDNVARS